MKKLIASLSISLAVLFAAPAVAAPLTDAQTQTLATTAVELFR